MNIWDELVGRQIVAVRYTRRKEAEKIWGDSPWGMVVLELDDGTILFPSQDEEMNGPGVLILMDGQGEFRWVFPPEG